MRAVLFKQRFWPGLKDGSITVTFRTWGRPRVRVGGRYRLDEATALEVGSVDSVSVRSISASDVRRAGFSSREELLDELRRSAGGPPQRAYRIAFRAVRAPDERLRLASQSRLTAEEAAELSGRLRRLDARSGHGPWTRRMLALIAANPELPAAQLAKRLGRETQPFKQDVRKLKALGLTISLERGYRLSLRGEAFLRRG
jgi:hypothetical protein